MAAERQLAAERRETNDLNAFSWIKDDKCDGDGMWLSEETTTAVANANIIMNQL